MKVNMQGLINRLDDLNQRLNYLFDKIERLGDLEQEEMLIEDVEQYFQNDDTFNLSIALDVLEQADKLAKVLGIIEEKNIDFKTLKSAFVCECDKERQCEVYNYNQWQWVFQLEHPGCVNVDRDKLPQITQEEYDLLKEILS